MSISGLILACGLTAVAIWSLISLPALHPVQLWSAPWALAAWVYAIRLLPYRSLSVGTVALALGATAAFAAGTLLTGGREGSREDAGPRLEFASIHRAAKISVILTAILLVAFLVQAAAAFGVHSALVSSLSVRNAIQHGHFSITIKFIYAAMGAIALSAVVAALSPEARQRRAWLVISAGCICSTYFATGRATVVDAVLVAGVAYSMSKARPLTTRRLLAGASVAAVLALGVFVADGALIGKTFSNDADIQSVRSVFVDHRALSSLALPYQYVSAPIAALDVQVATSTTWGDGHGCAAFEPICSVLRKLGLAVPSVPNIRAFTAPPLGWNTYTALDVPLIDGGTALAIPIFVLLGLLTGLIWRMARRRLLLGLVGYSLTSVALVTASGSFNFTAPYLWGGFVIVVIAFAAARVGPRLPDIMGARRHNRPQPASAIDA